MPELVTVADYITEARRILQDEDDPKRYPDGDLIAAINIAMMEARRIRPDLFLGRYDALPTVTAPTDNVEIDPMYRPSVLYYITGRVELRDSEDTKDQRATVLMNKFVAQLLTVQS